MHAIKPIAFDPARVGQSKYISVGRLMSPPEVESATRDRGAMEKEWVKDRWILCGDMHESMFDALDVDSGSNLPSRISVFDSPGENKYLVLTHQYQNHQHRFLLPLWDPSIARFIHAMDKGSLGFLLGRNGQSRALLVPGIQSAAELKVLQDFCTKPAPDRLAFMLGEMPLAMVTIAQLEAIPRLVDTEEVTEVSVSVLMPKDSIDEYEAYEARQANGTVH